MVARAGTVPCRKLTHLCDQEQVGGGVRAAKAVPRWQL